MPNPFNVFFRFGLLTYSVHVSRTNSDGNTLFPSLKLSENYKTTKTTFFPMKSDEIKIFFVFQFFIFFSRSLLKCVVFVVIVVMPYFQGFQRLQITTFTTFTTFISPKMQFLVENRFYIFRKNFEPIRQFFYYFLVCSRVCSRVCSSFCSSCSPLETSL